MDIICPDCGCSLDVPSEIAEGRHLQCPACESRFVISNGIATILPSRVRPKAIVCDDVQPRCTPVDFYSLNGEEEFRNYAWRRWTARAIDFYFGFVMMMLLFYFLAYLSGVTRVGLGFWDWIAKPANVWADYIITTLGAYFASVVIYAIFGTTLGKKICGLQVADSCGKCMPIGAYIIRETRVLLYGEWLCIPLLTMIGLISQYHHVTKTGHASYDDNWTGSDYYSRPTRGKGGFDAVLIVFVLIGGAILRNIMK